MAKKKVVDWRVSAAAIAALTIIELGAMHYGINGLFRSLIFAAIAALAGLATPTPELMKK